MNLKACSVDCIFNDFYVNVDLLQQFKGILPPGLR